MLLRKIVIFVSVILLFFCTTNMAMAEIRPGAFTISPMVGDFIFDDDLCLDEDDFPSLFTYGLGYNINENWTAELLLGYAYPYHSDTNQDVDVYQWELDFLFHLFPESMLTPYLEAGLGGLTYDPEDSSTQTRALMNVGAGLKWFLNDTFALRADVRNMLALNGLSFDDKEHHWSYTLGLTMSFGGEVKQPPPAPAPTPPPAPAPAPKPTPAPEPAPKDSDGDGVTDDMDKCPKTPAGVTVDERGCWVISTVVLFDFDKADLKPMAMEELDKAYEILKDDELKIEIQGHACNMGPDDYNQDLSESRAQTVKDYLVGKGIDEGRLTTMGYGESNPAADNTTEEGRMKNRRVEFKTAD